VVVTVAEFVVLGVLVLLLEDELMKLLAVVVLLEVL
jgi:hypothetical protein